jgi:Na+-transporting methylmalonyl-CoA/oxaloacetate decarboxylase gamma subunit
LFLGHLFCVLQLLVWSIRFQGDIVERHVQRRYGDAIKGNEFLTVATGRDDDARVWSEGKV